MVLDGVVPVRMERVWLQSHLLQFFVGHLDARWIRLAVQLSLHTQPRLGRRVANQLMTVVYVVSAAHASSC